MPVRYMEAIEALNSLTGGGSLYIQKKFVAGSGDIIDVTDAEVQLKITNLADNAAETLTLATLDASANFYSENADGSGWTYRYLLPAGTYRIEELSDSGAVINGSPFVTGQRLFTVNGQQSENSATVTLENGLQSNVSLYNVREFFDVKVVFEGVNAGGSKLELTPIDESIADQSFTYTDGDDPINVPAGQYKLTVTAPEGYCTKVTDFTFEAYNWNDEGKDEAQGIAWAFISEDGETGTFVITVTLEAAVVPAELAIVEQPTDQLVMVNGEAVFSVKATGDELSYQWEVNKGNGWMAIQDGRAASLRIGGIPIEADGQQFRCVITDAHGNTVTSNAATLHVYVEENVPIPETGDGIELFLFAGLAAATLLGMVGTRKREQN